MYLISQTIFTNKVTTTYRCRLADQSVFDFVKGYTVFFGNVFGIAYTLRRSDENLERTLSVFDTCYQTFNLAVALYGCVHLVKIASQIVHMGIKIALVPRYRIDLTTSRAMYKPSATLVVARLSLSKSRL